MNVAPDLDDQLAALKLAWAHKHIADLRRCLSDYLASEPYQVEQEAVGGGIKLILRVTQAPPSELSLIVGDALHNLRSALDVRLVSLAEQFAGPLNEDQERCLQLPDAATTEVLQKQTERWTKHLGSQVSAKLRLVVAPLLGHDIEPTYWMERHGGTASDEEMTTHQALASRLRRLNRLSNVDKHRRLHLPWLAPDSMYALMTGDSDVAWTVQPTPWSDGQEVARVTGPSATGQSLVHSAMATLTLVLPDRDDRISTSVADELENIAWFVEQALRIIDFGHRHLLVESP